MNCTERVATATHVASERNAPFSSRASSAFVDSVSVFCSFFFFFFFFRSSTPIPLSRSSLPFLSSLYYRFETQNSADRKALEIPAAVTAAAGAMLASPLAAHAEVTPSLKNLINSVVAGGVVLLVIVGAVTAVSGFDPVTRK